jgi:hypothetical protein
METIGSLVRAPRLFDQHRPASRGAPGEHITIGVPIIHEAARSMSSACAASSGMPGRGLRH